MGAIDETWEYSEIDDRILDVAIDGQGEAYDACELDLTPGRKRLIACAPEMARLLIKIGGFECPMCKSTFDPSGAGYVTHADGCDWLALMRKVGLR